ncbi:hypothetical protein BZG36_03990 [Bifiguratus adelaidae]|uniref:Uncharacterized protein n=1 Tax=Bifiguratus adelaidae TaxID=1938954 RepID=A0A261Y1R6_9FUNG|nr:hypothetical protein BZG36_03990 [Bifiguratus adelaidae]
MDSELWIQNSIQDRPLYPHKSVSVHQFSHLLTTHVLYDHVDVLLSHIAAKVSKQFRQMIHVESFGREGEGDGMDLDLLQGQLEGAIDGFIVDNLPSLAASRAPDLSELQLYTFILRFLSDTCPLTAPDVAVTSEKDVTVNVDCLRRHSKQILSTVHHHVRQHFIRALTLIEHSDLEPLFARTKLQVDSVIQWFNQDHPQLVVYADTRPTLFSSPEERVMYVDRVISDHGKADEWGDWESRGFAAENMVDTIAAMAAV